MIEDGALKEDFQVELIGVYSLKECLEREKELAKTSLYPKGLNGNAGSMIAMTEQVKKKISSDNKTRVKNGIHHFQRGDIQKESNRQRVENGSHHLLGPESNHRRIKNGTHNFLTPINKDRVTALNLETGQVSNIPKWLYYSEKDRYAVPNSKKFKQYKDSIVKSS